MKCQQCNRQFKTNAALAQHRRDFHSQAVQSTRARPARQVVRQPRATMPVIVSRGVDLLATAGVKATAKVGEVAFIQPLAPSDLPNSRLKAESELWSRWRPRGLVVNVTASGCATTYGSLVVGWTPDEHWSANNTSADFMRVSAFKPSVQMRLYESKRFSIPTETLTKWYLCDGEVGLSTHGSLVGVVGAAAGGFTGTITVNVTLEWAVEFEGAETPASVLQDTITCDAGWSNIFTTSDSSFNSERLTFKMHSGGDMVPFSSARSDRYYIPSGGTVVRYVDESKKTVACQFFAKVVGYATPGLLLFSTSEDAVAYVRSGDVTKAIKYTAASAVATPAKPRFVARVLPATLESMIPLRARELPEWEAFVRALSALNLGSNQASTASLVEEGAVGGQEESDTIEDIHQETDGVGVLAGVRPRACFSKWDKDFSPRQ